MPMTEHYTWRVVLNDGSEMEEYPDPSRHVSFRDVPAGDVALLAVEPNRHLGVQGNPVLVSIAGPNARAVFFRRHALGLQDGSHAVTTVFGWQDTVNGRNVKSLCWMRANGVIVLSDHDPDANEG